MASGLSVDDVLKTPSIQIVALLYIFPRIFMGYDKETLL